MSKAKDMAAASDQSSTMGSCLKNFSEYILAIISLLLLSPLIILLLIIIRISGKGPVIYTQDRIGKNGVPFSIYKFRSMKFNAENGSPMLSGSKENRVTRLGKVMRKYRIDEIPNFINVLKGEMAVVGPRPERKYFIDQILKITPEYSDILKVKPGITSLGQVMYGYASNVEEMVDRLRFDIYYVKHQAFWLDMKILILTIGTIVRGKGV